MTDSASSPATTASLDAAALASLLAPMGAVLLSTETIATTAERVAALQYEGDAGPCLTSCRDQVSVRIDDVSRDDRWPEWNREVAQLGVRAMLSVPLVTAGTSMGAIKVYSTWPAAFDAHAEHLLGLFARQAAILLVNVQTLADARRTNVQLTEALHARDLIGQAKGILLARDAANDEAAFALLISGSQRAGVKLQEFARQLVESVASQSAPSPVGAQE